MFSPAVQHAARRHLTLRSGKTVYRPLAGRGDLRTGVEPRIVALGGRLTHRREPVSGMYPLACTIPGLGRP